MSDSLSLPLISLEELRTVIASRSNGELYSVLLTSGEVLLGEINQRGQQNPKAIQVAFNMPDGKRYGRAVIVEVPVTRIASIQRVPLSEDSIPKFNENDPEVAYLKEMGFIASAYMKLPVHNYPNPLASIIFEHNRSIIDRHRFDMNYYVEESLAQDGISTTGIEFDDDFLLYADWDFFNSQSSAGTTIAASPIPGLIQIEKSLQMSPEQQVLQRLRGTLGEGIRRRVSPSVGNYTVLRGALLVPDPAQDEVIEGELSYLYQLGDSTDGILHPILIKARLVKYPLGFLPHINSSLVCYGEMLPIPVNILGKTYERVLLVRALAHIRDN